MLLAKDCDHWAWKKAKNYDILSHWEHNYTYIYTCTYILTVRKWMEYSTFFDRSNSSWLWTFSVHYWWRPDRGGIMCCHLWASLWGSTSSILYFCQHNGWQRRYVRAPFPRWQCIGLDCVVVLCVNYLMFQMQSHQMTILVLLMWGWILLLEIVEPVIVSASLMMISVRMIQMRTSFLVLNLVVENSQ